MQEDMMIEPGRRDDEPERPFAAFCIYAALGAFRRSFAAVAERLDGGRAKPALIGRWARRYKWLDRVNEWDAQVAAAERIRQDQRFREALFKPFEEAIERYMSLVGTGDLIADNEEHIAAMIRVMIALPLAEKGFEITGSPEAKAMFAETREKFEQSMRRQFVADLAGPAPEWVELN